MGQACAERWRPRLSGWASRGAASSSISRARAPRPVSSRRATAPSRRRRKVQAMVSEGGVGTTSVSMRELLLRCPQCGATTSGDTTQFRCACGTPFDLPDASFEHAGESAEALRARFHGRLSALGGSARSGVWRYRELILPLAEEHIVSRQEGNTPLYAVGAGERDGWRKIGMYAGLERLFLKHEGENPTGSFKDPGMTGGMSVARALGVRAVAWAALPRGAERRLVGRVPRLGRVQATGADPFYRSFASGWRDFAPVHASTRATAINIGAPVSYARARAVVEATGGVVTEVSDDEIFAAKAIIDRAGIGCEPASAASVAGARRLVAEGVIAPDAHVVAVLTGHLLKDIEQATGERPAGEPEQAEVDELLRDIHQALSS